MKSFTTSDIQRFAIATVGPVALSSISIFAAVAPVKAATPTDAGAWEQTVANKIGTASEPAWVRNPAQLTRAEVNAHFTANGDFAGATLARSSGLRAVDARALRIARTIRYPALPGDLRGQPQTVHMELYFGGLDTEAAYLARKAQKARTVQFAATAEDSGIQVATR